MDYIITLLEAFHSEGEDRPLVAGSTPITQLYQECCRCILKILPLGNAGIRLYPGLAETLVVILYHHVKTMEERCGAGGLSSSENYANHSQQFSLHRVL